MWFFYKGLTTTGSYRYGFLRVENRFEGLKRLLKISLYPQAFLQVGWIDIGKIFHLFKRGQERLSFPLWLTLLERIVFLMKSGCSLVRALHSIEAGLLKPSQRLFVQSALNQLLAGHFFYEIVQKLPQNCINEQQLKLIQCAEMGGYLENGLQACVQQNRLNIEIRRQWINSLIYPCVVLCVALLAGFVLGSYVLPEFKLFLEAQAVKLSGFINIFLNTGIYLGTHLPLILLVTIIFLYLFRNSLKVWFRQHILSQGPLKTHFLEPLRLGLFAMNFSALLKNGLYLLESLRLSAPYLDPKRFKIDAILEKLKNGIPLSAALSELPPFFLETLQSAELSGSLQEALESLSHHYLQIYKNHLTQVTKWLEPLSLIAIAVLIISLIFCFFLPLTQLFQAINFEG